MHIFVKNKDMKIFNTAKDFLTKINDKQRFISKKIHKSKLYSYSIRFLEMYRTGKIKAVLYTFFLGVVTFFYFAKDNPLFAKDGFKKDRNEMQTLNDRLEINQKQALYDSIVQQTEQNNILTQINDKLVDYLFKINNYQDITLLKPYLSHSPKLLDQIPSCAPLQKGNYYKSSDFGIREHPITHQKKTHFGIDLAASEGKKVFATAHGKVIKVNRSNTGYGYHVIIKHRFGFQTVYGHLSKILVLEGQAIKQNQLIGLVGTTGLSTGPHLHYEIIKKNKKIDPFLSFNLKYDVLKTLIASE